MVQQAAAQGVAVVVLCAFLSLFIPHNDTGHTQQKRQNITIVTNEPRQRIFDDRDLWIPRSTNISAGLVPTDYWGL